MKEITSLKNSSKWPTKKGMINSQEKVSCFGKLTNTVHLQVHPVTTEHNSLQVMQLHNLPHGLKKRSS